jgi:hypothetical protein
MYRQFVLYPIDYDLKYKLRDNSVAKARPQDQNPRGERLTPVLLWQGLVLSPPSLGQTGKTAS